MTDAAAAGHRPTTPDCPCCGRPWPQDSADLDRLLALLRGDPSREVYEAIDGLYYVTHTSFPVPRAAVKEAARRGLIEPQRDGRGDRDWIFKLAKPRLG